MFTDLWLRRRARQTSEDYVNTAELIACHPTRLDEVALRQQFDNEAVVLRVSGKVAKPAARIPAVIERVRGTE